MKELCESCKREKIMGIEYPGVCDTCGNIISSIQPERLKPEASLYCHKNPVGDWGKIWRGCDSPNCGNK